MLKGYRVQENKLLVEELGAGAIPAAGTTWLDLVDPTLEERTVVADALGIEVPTREEMYEIEVSSRLYMEEDVPFMTALILFHADTPQPETTPITFILTNGCLVTVRYAEPASFRTFIAQIGRRPLRASTPEHIICGLLEAVTERIADILERAAGDLDAVSREVFSETNGAHRRKRRDLTEVLRRIGRSGDLISKTRESLVSITRLITFLSATSKANARKGLRVQLKTLARDTVSLSDHAAFEANNVNFLLQATLGVINIEQNAIIKTFTVAAVAFMPPTLIASIYGMNFDVMPELKWPLGYAFALGVMVLSAILPLLYFKRKGWL
ncbi:MAG: magnesium/cobalt transporter CorA [Alphaproteobacteria bacterium]|nr:magnesium/cobalt transporter CorA [Alphaproteobacteria bacterium]